MKLLLALLLCCVWHQAVADVPPQRLATLSRGVNLIDVFSETTTLATLRNEIKAIHQNGFRHIRFFLDPGWVWRTGEPQRLDQVIDAALAAHLGVIICMQSYQQSFKDDPAIIDRWTQAWLKVAGHYSKTNPDTVFFELVNEPSVNDAARWADIQEHMRQQVRSIVPNHTLLLTGSPISTASALAELPPSTDGNVAYVFHLYAPMVFTHQGAEWADPEFATVRGLRYPPEQNNLIIVGHAAAPKLRGEIDQYAQLGRGVILHNAEPALDWARRNHTQLVVTEFGVYRPAAPPPSRNAWLHDARIMLEKAGVGWTVWEYNGGFGVKPELDLGCGPLPIALGLCS